MGRHPTTVKTVILDDDPTGTQSSQHVRVLLDTAAELIETELRTVDTLFLQTNSRAIDEGAAVNLVRRIRHDTLRVAHALGHDVQFVLRGDSTLRGHVFAETEVFRGPDTLMLFVPAFPAGGRTTVGGVHQVRVDGHDVPAHQTEYARDPVFGFRTGVLADYVAQRSADPVVSVGLATVRGDREGLIEVFTTAPRRAVIVPDAQTDGDIGAIAAATIAARHRGREIVVRCAAPLAATLGAVSSSGFLPLPVLPSPQPTVLVCGSHTTGATRQLAAVTAVFGDPVSVDTDQAMADPTAAGRAAAAHLLDRLRRSGLAILSSERVRRDHHNSLDHGEKIMAALTEAVRLVSPHVGVVVAKGGITSAEVAKSGLRSRSGTVLGQIAAGVSAWQLDVAGSRTAVYIVVPGNVGDDATLLHALAAVGFGIPS
jgi:uncharacterized protein YgbK (DUF1537 family)